MSFVNGTTRVPTGRAHRKSWWRWNRRAVAVALAIAAIFVGTVVITPGLAQRVTVVQPTLPAMSAPAPGQPQPPRDTAPAPALTIDLPSGAAGSTGFVARWFKPGEHVSLRVRPSHDAYIYCYLRDESRHIVRFYPNRFSPSALVTSLQPLELPGRMGFEIVANSRRVTETVACFASERDVMGELPAAVVGTDFATLPAASLDEVRSAFASVIGGTLTEASLQVRIK